ncbi:hypothetical protein OUZ56_028266 [Daphnia magna]|uniref:Uncharacterized protein n=1 Tax=Daphnia magna TaxID=35525 RepID=A0ABR0B3B9_9CRUS|nr:hypothetical protein OUZ56_028266 [Daphnia magna]
MVDPHSPLMIASRAERLFIVIDVMEQLVNGIDRVRILGRWDNIFDIATVGYYTGVAGQRESLQSAMRVSVSRISVLALLIQLKQQQLSPFPDYVIMAADFYTDELVMPPKKTLSRAAIKTNGPVQLKVRAESFLLPQQVDDRSVSFARCVPPPFAANTNQHNEDVNNPSAKITGQYQRSAFVTIWICERKWRLERLRTPPSDQICKRFMQDTLGTHTYFAFRFAIWRIKSEAVGFQTKRRGERSRLMNRLLQPKT